MDKLFALKKEVRELVENPDTSAKHTVVITETVRFVDVEDGGQAIICQCDEDPESEFFVKLQSWSEKLDHSTIKKFLGRKVKITIETKT